MRSVQVAIFALVAFTGIQAAAQTDIDLRETRSRSLGVRDLDDPSFTTFSIGPAMTTGLDADQAMLNLNAALNYNMFANISGKLFGDAILGSDDDSSRFLNFGLGVDFYPTEARV